MVALARCPIGISFRMEGQDSSVSLALAFRLHRFQAILTTLMTNYDGHNDIQRNRCVLHQQGSVKIKDDFKLFGEALDVNGRFSTNSKTLNAFCQCHSHHCSCQHIGH